MRGLLQGGQYPARKVINFTGNLEGRHGPVAPSRFIDPNDGTCSECDGGHLQVIGANDVTMSVECAHCGAVEKVEHDAFDDGLGYLLRFLAAQRGTNKYRPDDDDRL